MNMTEDYFKDIPTSERKAHFRKLAKIHHPDHGGSHETMLEIYLQYKKAGGGEDHLFDFEKWDRQDIPKEKLNAAFQRSFNRMGAKPSMKEDYSFRPRQGGKTEETIAILKGKIDILENEIQFLKELKKNYNREITNACVENSTLRYRIDSFTKCSLLQRLWTALKNDL